MKADLSRLQALDELGRVPYFIAQPIWDWLKLNADVELFHARIFFWRITIRVRDLYPFMETILGKPQTPS